MIKPILIIMAGGFGERFWPRSRRRLPKQLLPLVGDQSLLQESVERIRPLTDDERIFIVTNGVYSGEVKKQLPFLPPCNIIDEPVSRNTAPCIALAALYAAKRFPGEDPVLAFLPSDAMIKDADEMRKILRSGFHLCEKMPHGILLGMKPNRPETGFGYIQLGEQLGDVNGVPYFGVASFKEKPDASTAVQYFVDEDYYWNAGIFIWKLQNILNELNQHLPEIMRGLEELEPYLGTDGAADKLNEIYPRLPAISIDYGLIERTENLLVIPADFGWDDLGSWGALNRYLPADEAGNIVQGEHCGLDTRDCIIRSPRKMVATLGVRDLIIVEDDDVLLVCSKEKGTEIKKILEELKKKGRTDLL